MLGQHLTQIVTVAILILSLSASHAKELTAEQSDFFESRIRPVLVEACYSCHNSSDTAEGDLALDSRDGIRKKSEYGIAVVPSDVDKSLLLKVIRHEIDGLEMPEDGAKLTNAVIADFEKWVRMGAPDPRDAPPSANELIKATSWPEKLEQRKQWWSLQPIRNPTAPDAKPNSSEHPVDRFIDAQLSAQGLTRTNKADKHTLIRRLSFALLGLPPSVEQTNAFVADISENAFENLVDEMLDSEHFGERWARHWMDLVRYADSHGSEGDPTIPHAYQYRDYLIRAFNADLPYDQFVREHIAGDLLTEPRINADLGINESQIGPAHLRFVFHGFAPTDALDEKVRFTDDQVNVISKTFLGMTVSCARCHDHKFDAISQTDYYAMFGVLANPRPALVDVNTPQRQHMHKEKLSEVKSEIREALANNWLRQIESNDFLPADTKEIAERFQESVLFQPWVESIKNESSNSKSKENGDGNADSDTAGDDATFADSVGQQLEQWNKNQQTIDDDTRAANAWRWDLTTSEDYNAWFRDGNGLSEQPADAGDFAIAHDGPAIIDSIMPAGVHTRRLTTKHRGFLTSPRFFLNDEYNVWLRVQGQNGSTVRYSVQHYPRDGTVYPIREIKNDNWGWQHLNLDYWKGDDIHLEINTGQDAPIRTRGGDRSWFGIREVVVRKKGLPAPPANDREFLGPVFDAIAKAQPTSSAEMARCYQVAIANAVNAWQKNEASDEQALLLNEAVRNELLTNDLEDDERVAKMVRMFRELESEIPMPTRAPGVLEAGSYDQPLFERGNHLKPLEPVRRRFLEAIDSAPYETENSGRLNLANDLVRADNPLTARVAVNRIWHYLFGRGIVETPDNFGRLGALPSHPELLDYLATRFQKNGWTFKDAIRFLVTSETWQQSTTASAAAKNSDPGNQWLSHANVQRLDAESLRDALLAVTGRLDRELYGRGFGPNSDAKRRAVYVTSRRNNLDQFLAVFDSPVPFATTGRRSVTNVPAQSLTLLNAPFVMRLAAEWSQETGKSETTDEQRVARMFAEAFGRPANDDETKTLINYLASVEKHTRQQRSQRKRVEQQISETQTSVAAILDPIRECLTASIAKDDATDAGLNPIAAWDFETDSQDSIGNLHGKPNGNAKIEDGALALDGQSFVATSPMERDLKEKTLEAWVQLANLGQKGGGAITVQSLNGVTFDSIVFAERQEKRWMAGSDGFRRTDDFGGPSEDENALETAVHIVVAYDSDGTIRGYRNGEPYGKPIKKAGLVTFRKNDTQILFGLRHGDDDPGRMLAGSILEARLYDRALTAEEISESAQGKGFVSEKAIFAELSPRQQQNVNDKRSALAKLKSELNQLNASNTEQDPWALLAHALFNMKEFIYIR